MKNIIVAGTFVIIPEASLTPENMYEGAVILREKLKHDPAKYKGTYSFLAIDPAKYAEIRHISDYELDEALRSLLNPSSLRPDHGRVKTPSELESLMGVMERGYEDSSDIPSVPIYGMRKRVMSDKATAKDGSVHMPDELKKLLANAPSGVLKGVLAKMKSEMDLTDEQVNAIRKSIEAFKDQDDDEDGDSDLSEILGSSKEEEEEETKYEPEDFLPCFDLQGPYLILRGPTQETTQALYGKLIDELDPDLIIFEFAEGCALGGSRKGSGIVSSSQRMDLRYSEIEAALHETEGSTKPLSDSELVDKFLEETNWV